MIDTSEVLFTAAARESSMVRATVRSLDGAAVIWCSRDEEDTEGMQCELLHTSEGPPLQLAAGDSVLVCWPSSEQERGVILGRIGSSGAPAVQPQEIPDELVIEARQNLTFKCGQGSITLRADGKILIKGKDLVSHAQRLNRIKGGSVTIN